MQVNIRLTDEQKRQIKEEIHDFFLDERDEDIGIIQQEKILDFFMENLAPIIYDKALDDAKYWFSKRMNEAESDYYDLYKR